MTRFIVCLLVGVLGGWASTDATKADRTSETGDTAMKLGAFSISLAVKDLAASREFYEKLGFRTMGFGDEKTWLILQNGTTTIGLFQGLFDKNIMTFNPGWDSSAKPVKEFDDVRAIQKDLESRGLTLMSKADPASTGPASLMLVDPDGNTILMDQHVPKPTK